MWNSIGDERIAADAFLAEVRNRHPLGEQTDFSRSCSVNQGDGTFVMFWQCLIPRIELKAKGTGAGLTDRK
jgi:hypothetical protein